MPNVARTQLAKWYVWGVVFLGAVACVFSIAVADASALLNLRYLLV